MEKLFRIGDAAQRAGVSVQTVKNYEREGLVQIPRDSTGQRLLTFDLIEQIRRIYAEKRISNRMKRRR